MDEDEPLWFTDPDDILRLALSRPEDALARARSIIMSSSDAYVLSVARHAVGIVLRDRGDSTTAIHELRSALRMARTSARPNRIADVQATLGAALVMDGKTSSGLHQLDQSAQNAKGEMLAKVLMRRSYVLSLIGRYTEALVDMRRALVGIRRAGNTVWEARALDNRGEIQIALGNVSRAERDVHRAEMLFLATGQDLEAVVALHNRGTIAYRKGDLPTALTLYDEAATRYAALGVTWPDLAIDRCVALLAAGLMKDAAAVIGAALATDSVQPSKRAELKLMLATASLSAGDAGEALANAEEARRAFRRQRRDWWEVRADLVIARANYVAGRGGRRMLQAAVSLGDRLEAMRAEEAPVAMLLAGRLAADLHLDSCQAHYAAAARYRRHGSGLVRATGWLAQALGCEAAGKTRGVLAACARGLDALDEHRMTLGSTEMRALATLHGRELAAIALRQASTTRGPREMLRWSERWRATTLTQPPVRPPHEGKLAAELAALRDNVRRLDKARGQGAPIGVLEHERARRELSIRAQLRKLAGSGGDVPPLELETLMGALGDAVLVELVEIEGTINVLLVKGGRVRRFLAGSVDDALRAVEFARFALRQAARGRPTDLGYIGRKLQDSLLGDAAKLLGSDPVIVSPTSRFHSTPWPLLPALAATPVSVTPSAALWLRARAARRPSRSRTVLIAGPGLPAGDAEVSALARLHPDALVLRDEAATVEQSLRALDGATLAHLAAHGRYRSDSPMFSCLDMADGPLTVHDVEQLDNAPYRLFLSACDSGLMAAVGANEVLGLASALFSIGTAGVVCSVAEVNDVETALLMLDVHEGVQAGESPADVLCRVRLAVRGEPVREATAASFVSMGI